MNAGWIPPWRQTSVAPRSHAFLRAGRSPRAARGTAPAQVLGEPLRERAEAAAEVADVRVLDVPGDDVGHLVTADLPPEPVRGGEDALRLAPPRGQQTCELVLAELAAGELERAASRRTTSGARPPPPAPRRRPWRALRRRPPGARRRRLPGRPSARGRRRARGRAETWRELEALAPRCVREPLGASGHGASGFTWSIVTGETLPSRRSPRRAGEGSRRTRGSGRLHVPPGSEQYPRGGDRPQVLVERGLGVRGHARPRLRAEVLDDDLLDVPVLLAERTQGEDGSIRSSRVSPMPIRIPLVNGIELPRAADRPAAGRALSGDAQCGPPRSPERLCGRLEHDPHRRRHRPQRLELGARHITPGFRCGRRPVSSSTSRAQRSRYSSVVSQPSAASSSRATRYLRSGRSPSVKSASRQPAAAPARDRQHASSLR